MSPQPAPAPPASQKMLTGPVHGVPCPHCSKRNDCRRLLEQSLLEPGSKIDCDHCHNLMEVMAIVPVPMVQVRQLPGQAPRPAPAPAPPPGTNLMRRGR